MSMLAVIVALPAAAFAIAIALRTRLRDVLVAVPTGERWHDKATPLLGGIGIFAGLAAGFWLTVALGGANGSRELVGIFAGAAILFVAGTVDDVYHLPPLAKLALQFAAAATVIATGTHVEIIGNSVIATALAVFWIVAMTNAFNLLDNIDGLAASLAAIAFAFFAIDAVTVHPNHAAFALATAGALACAGFLPFNLRPGRKALVFMGDSGSQVLGFVLATLGLASSWKVAGTTVATMILPILVLAVPILDTTLVTVVRLMEGRPISQGGRDHSSHRLVRLGLSDMHSVLLLALIATGLGATSLTYNVLNNQRLTLVGVLLTFMLLVEFASFLADVERRAVPGAPTQSLLQTFSVHWRRLVEVAVDFAVIGGSFALAYAIEFGWPGTTNQRHLATVTLPILIGARYLAFIPLGLYRAIWRYAGSRDAVAIVFAVVLSEAVTLAFITQTQALVDFARPVFVIDALICAAAIGASRFAERLAFGGGQLARHRSDKRTLIVGAGRTGRSLARELRETVGERVLGFVDDNPRLRRRRLVGVPVVGGTHELERLLQKHTPDLVLVTIPGAPRERLDAIVEACAARGVECRFVRREIDLDPRVVLGAAAE